MIDPNIVPRLYAQMQAVCPLRGCPIVPSTDPTQVTFLPAATATPQQIQAAQNVINTFDFSDNAQQRYLAQQLASDNAAQNKLLRALLMVLLDEINTLRGALPAPLVNRTPAQLRTAIATKLSSGAAD